MTLEVGLGTLRAQSFLNYPAWHHITSAPFSQSSLPILFMRVSCHHSHPSSSISSSLRPIERAYLVELHEPLPQPVNLVSINCPSPRRRQPLSRTQATARGSSWVRHGAWRMVVIRWGVGWRGGRTYNLIPVQCSPASARSTHQRVSGRRRERLGWRRPWSCEEEDVKRRRRRGEGREGSGRGQ